MINEILIRQDWMNDFYDKYRVYPRTILLNWLENRKIYISDYLLFLDNPTEENYMEICKRVDRESRATTLNSVLGCHEQDYLLKWNKYVDYLVLCVKHNCKPHSFGNHEIHETILFFEETGYLITKKHGR